MAAAEPFRQLSLSLLAADLPAEARLNGSCLRDAGGGRVHVQDGQARAREVPFRGAGHLHAEEDGGARAVFPQPGCARPHSQPVAAALVRSLQCKAAATEAQQPLPGLRAVNQPARVALVSLLRRTHGNRTPSATPLSSALMSSLWQVPHVSRQDYSLLDISDDGFVRFRRALRVRQ